MKALIIEDEILASKHLLQILDEVGDISVITILESITETIEWFSKNQQPDIVFMDIHLADGSAFEIFKQINIACPIVFTTAYDEYALKAFKVNSIDYLLKPIEVSDVQDATKIFAVTKKRDEELFDYDSFGISLDTYKETIVNHHFPLLFKLVFFCHCLLLCYVLKLLIEIWLMTSGQANEVSKTSGQREAQDTRAAG